MHIKYSINYRSDGINYSNDDDGDLVEHVGSLGVFSAGSLKSSQFPKHSPFPYLLSTDLFPTDAISGFFVDISDKATQGCVCLFRSPGGNPGLPSSSSTSAFGSFSV